MPVTRKYGRASTGKQHFSQGWQDQVCDEYINSHPKLPKCSQEMFFDNAYSGSIPLADRPAGAELLLQSQAGDHIVVVSHDRLGRDFVDSIQSVRLFHKRGVFVHLLDMLFISRMDPEDPMAETMLAQLAVLGQVQRKQVSIKTKQGIDYRKTIGIGHNSGNPLGYRTIENPEWNPADPDDVKRKKGRYLLIPDPQGLDYFQKAFTMIHGGEKIATTMRHLKKHPDAGNWTYARLYYHLCKENDRLKAEHNRRQRKDFFSDSH